MLDDCCIFNIIVVQQVHVEFYIRNMAVRKINNVKMYFKNLGKAIGKFLRKVMSYAGM